MEKAVLALPHGRDLRTATSLPPVRLLLEWSGRRRNGSEPNHATAGTVARSVDHVDSVSYGR